jgi:hypothetical protein
MTELLSLARMARRLDVASKWLRDQADAGEVPSLKAGTRYLFNAAAVEQVLADKAATSWNPTKPRETVSRHHLEAIP